MQGCAMNVRESMTRVESDGFTIRVWRDESLREDIQDRARVREQIFGSMKMGLNTSGTAQVIMQLTGVSAVEILDRNGDGEVWYANWP